MTKKATAPSLAVNLQVRVGDDLVPAPAEDQAVAGGYATANKGVVVQNYRISILTSGLSRAVDEPVRVVHACESLSTTGILHIVGPKPVLGEYVDDELVTPPSTDADPLTPSTYDGRVWQGQGVDFGYDITEYRFHTPGRHSVQWRLDPYVSNEIMIEVT